MDSGKGVVISCAVRQFRTRTLASPDINGDTLSNLYHIFSSGTILAMSFNLP